MQIQEKDDFADGSVYEHILAALDSVPWDRAPEVFPIRPLARTNIDFFPGHCGYVGPEFPLRDGIMVVANNFSSVKGWQDYSGDADRESMTRTWRNLRLMIEASGVEIERFWFTNYCHGVMEQGAESYDFPGRIIKTLEFDRVFEKCVGAMRPALIVSLGRLAARHLGTDYARRETIERRTIASHPTKLMAAVHPSAWTWQKRGFTDQDFRLEGERIGSAFRD